MPLHPSDLGSFTYCPVQWKLTSERQGQRQNRRHGIESHAQLRREIVRVRNLGIESGLRFLYALGAGMLMLMSDTLSELFPELNDPLTITFYILALLTVVLGVRAYAGFKRWRSEESALGVQVFALESLDLPWASEAHDLVGKPDYVAQQEGHSIPVEFKSGEYPSKPWDNHVVQLGAYALLLEAAHGKRPPYGILQYPNGQHRVDFNDERMEKLVLPQMRRLREAVAGAPVVRDHNQPRKCEMCSERFRCDQRLS